MRRTRIILALLLCASAPAFAEVWDTTTPLGSESKNQGDNRIREMKAAIESALGWSGVFPGTNPATAPIYQWTLSYGLAAARPTSSVQDGQVYRSTDSGSVDLYNGTSWQNAGVVFSSGTKMMFYQATCPAGWTGVGTSINDKFVRAVTTGTTGGSTGGTVAASTSLAHTHTVADHTHTISASGTHTHSGGSTGATATNAYDNGDGGGVSRPPLSHTHGLGTSTASGDHSHGGSTDASADPLTDSQLGVMARIDVIVCQMD